MSSLISIIDSIDALIRRDPAGRGLISAGSMGGSLCLGHLRGAAESLATTAREVAIVTGFFVPDANPPAAETDGPPGALVLAAALESIGVRTTIVTDTFCAKAIQVAAVAAGRDLSSISVCPNPAADWLETFFQDGPGKRLTHLVAIERVGPSHDEASLIRQVRPGPPPRAEFLQRLAPEHRSRCHNVRGVIIDDSTPPLHRLFETAAQGPKRRTTIGIGDGGNEIGMGAILWEDLARNRTRPEAARIPCRIATDWTILAGTSNWGGFGLAAATLLAAGRAEALAPWDEAFHRKMLEQMVAQGPAVDGMTRRRQATVDGLPFTTYVQIWLGIRRLALAGTA